MATDDNLPTVTCEEFRAWLSKDDEEDFVDDPVMDRHFESCEDCDEWAEVEMDLLIQDRLPGFDRLDPEEQERFIYLMIKSQLPPTLN